MSIKIHLWDTSGSERYRSVSVGHYRDALGALLTFDITNRESFDALEYWVNEIKDQADELVIITVVPNKQDLVDMGYAVSAVSEQEIHNFAERHKLKYRGKRISALKNTYVKEIFDELIKGKLHTDFNNLTNPCVDIY